MHILLIGGSRFVGYHLVEAALGAGHQVTMFNRGQSNPGAFPSVEELHGDRDGGLDILTGRQWDAVIDTCGYIPRHVRDSATFLRDAVGRYVFISTISVYQDFPITGITEDSPLATLEDESTEQVMGETYGGLKVLCEREVQQVYGQQALIIRPGLIVGPRDRTNRFGYWVRRAADGGEILAPGTPERPVQFIDGRDLATWTIDMTERQQTGVYNAVGPAEVLTMGEFLQLAIQIGENPTATLTWVEDDFLVAQGVAYWQHLPLWVAPDTGINRVNNHRAAVNGLRFRDTATIIRDTLASLRTHESPPENPHGAISAQREAELLAAWRAHSPQK